VLGVFLSLVSFLGQNMVDLVKKTKNKKMPTSTLQQIEVDGMNYLWDSITGFFYNANGKDFIIVSVILFSVVCIVILSIKYVFGGGRPNLK
jgi:hypothetical protein